MIALAVRLLAGIPRNPRSRTGALDGTARSQRGFLLLQLLIATSLSAIVGTLLVGSLFQVNRAADDGGARFAVATNVRTAQLWISRDVHSAKITSLLDGGGAAAWASFEWTDESGPRACEYELDGTDLVRTCNGASSVASRGVSGLEFTRTGGLVTVSFTVTAPDKPAINETVQINLALRNG